MGTVDLVGSALVLEYRSASCSYLEQGDYWCPGTC
jgi:hypothetical protein